MARIKKLNLFIIIGFIQIYDSFEGQIAKILLKVTVIKSYFIPKIFKMIQLQQTNSENADFRKLVQDLDKYLAVCDGDEHGFYDQFNKLDQLDHVIVAYAENVPVGCGAFKKFGSDSVEIKRMYVKPEYRNQGLASMILRELENWAESLGFAEIYLETGKRQTEAVAFYHKLAYQVIPNYPPYENMENSLCFQKKF